MGLDGLFSSSFIGLVAVSCGRAGEPILDYVLLILNDLIEVYGVFPVDERHNDLRRRIQIKKAYSEEKWNEGHVPRKTANASLHATVLAVTESIVGGEIPDYVIDQSQEDAKD